MVSRHQGAPIAPDCREILGVETEEPEWLVSEPSRHWRPAGPCLVRYRSDLYGGGTVMSRAEITQRLMDDGLSENAAETLRKIGNFSPTANAADREVKGYAEWGSDEPGKVYLSSKQIREFAAGLTEVADWLDARAGGSAHVG